MAAGSVFSSKGYLLARLQPFPQVFKHRFHQRSCLHVQSHTPSPATPCLPRSGLQLSWLTCPAVLSGLLMSRCHGLQPTERPSRAPLSSQSLDVATGSGLSYLTWAFRSPSSSLPNPALSRPPLLGVLPLLAACHPIAAAGHGGGPHGSSRDPPSSCHAPSLDNAVSTRASPSSSTTPRPWLLCPVPAPLTPLCLGPSCGPAAFAPLSRVSTHQPSASSLV